MEQSAESSPPWPAHSTVRAFSSCVESHFASGSLLPHPAHWRMFPLIAFSVCTILICLSVGYQDNTSPLLLSPPLLPSLSTGQPHVDVGMHTQNRSPTHGAHISVGSSLTQHASPDTDQSPGMIGTLQSESPGPS